MKKYIAFFGFLSLYSGQLPDNNQEELMTIQETKTELAPLPPLFNTRGYFGNQLTVKKWNNEQLKQLSKIAGDIYSPLVGQSLPYMHSFLQTALVSYPQWFEGKEKAYSTFVDFFQQLDESAPMFIPYLSEQEEEPTFLDTSTPMHTLLMYCDMLRGTLDTFCSAEESESLLRSLSGTFTKKEALYDFGVQIHNRLKTFHVYKDMAENLTHTDVDFFGNIQDVISQQTNALPGTVADYFFATQAITKFLYALKNIEIDPNSGAMTYSDELLNWFKDNEEDAREEDMSILHRILAKADYADDYQNAIQSKDNILKCIDAFEFYEIDGVSETLDTLDEKIKNFKTQ